MEMETDMKANVIDEERIAQVVKELKTLLIERGETLCTAESCTGGLIASSIVNEPGSSSILQGGIVAYQNEVKQSLLSVSTETLGNFGAVSKETVEEMARGAITKFKCNWAVSTSGIAGPGGAEPGKPVGTVWMCITHKNDNGSLQNTAFCKIFLGNRQKIRTQAVYTVLSKLIFLINKQKSTCTTEH